ncbi:MAG: tetratricopeptide repeat protein [Acidobacteriota bacterium]
MVNLHRLVEHPRWLWPLAIGLAGVVYANTLSNGFTYDDTPIIVNNPAIRSLSEAHRLFLTGYWEHRQAGVNNYRPLLMLTLAVDYAVWGLHPFGYHLMNVILHIGNVAWLLCLLRLYRVGPWLAGLAALVFAVHPVHTEAVANVVGRAELLGMWFGGLMWWSWVRARRSPDQAGRWRTLAAAAYLAAMLSKENMVVLPAALWLAEVLRARRRLWRAGWPGWWAATRPFFWLTVPWLLYVALRLASGQGFRPVTALSGNPMHAQTFWERLVTIAGVSLEWYRLVILGFPLKPWYDAYNLVLTPAWSWRTLLGVLITVGLVVGAAAAARRFPLLTFAVGFWFITLALVSHVIVPLWTPLGERWLYVPSAAYALALAWALTRLAREARGEPFWLGMTCHRLATSTAIGCFLAVSYAYGTVQRNLDWRDDWALFSRFLETDPQHPLPYTSLAHAYQMTDPDRARAYYKAALVREPNFFLALLGLAQLELRSGNLGVARATLAQVMASKPPEIVPMDADWGLAHALYARMLALENDVPGVREHIAEARRYGPQDAPTLVSCAIAYVTLGQPAEAEAILREALATGVDTPTIRFNLASLLLKQGKLDEAERHFETALRLDPNFAPARQALGKLYSGRQ